MNAPWVDAKVKAAAALTELGMLRRGRAVLTAGRRCEVMAKLRLAKMSVLDHWDVVAGQHPSQEDTDANLGALDAISAALEECESSSLIEALARDSTCPPTLRPEAP